MPAAAAAAIWSIFSAKDLKFTPWIRTPAPRTSRSRQGTSDFEPIEAISFPDGSFDVVLAVPCSTSPRTMPNSAPCSRVCGGFSSPAACSFCRLASSIGIEHQIRPLNGRRHLLPDGSERYLVDETFLVQLTSELGARLLDPLKTTVIQNQRAMTTWVLPKTLVPCVAGAAAPALMPTLILLSRTAALFKCTNSHEALYNVKYSYESPSLDPARHDPPASS